MTTFAEKNRTDMMREKHQVASPQEAGQYTLWQILGIWALVALPMLLLTWVVTPAIIPYSPLHPGITFWLLIIAGMVWEFIVAVGILYHELGTLRWSAIRQRVWLQTPRDPQTGHPNRKLYWWLLPLLLLSGLTNFALDDFLNAPMAWLFPAMQEPQYMQMAQLMSPEFHGQWWILGIALVSISFNYFLGEEFLFRGVLLPKMQGVFGKYDWVANAVLFGFYHLHKPWALSSIIASNSITSWPAARFRSNWMAIIIHGIQGIPVLFITLAVILGLLG